MMTHAPFTVIANGKEYPGKWLVDTCTGQFEGKNEGRHGNTGEGADDSARGKLRGPQLGPLPPAPPVSTEHFLWRRCSLCFSAENAQCSGGVNG